MSQVKYIYTPLYELPKIITDPGAYLTREGLTVQVDKVGNVWGQFNCTGTYPSGIRENWHVSGRIWPNQECNNDIVSKALP